MQGETALLPTAEKMSDQAAGPAFGRKPAVEKNRQSQQQQYIYEFESRYGPNLPGRTSVFFVVFVVVDDLAVAQKRHPIFFAKFWSQKIAVPLAVVPPVANARAVEPMGARRAIAKCHGFGDG
jgi:hypothetical protein